MLISKVKTPAASRKQLSLKQLVNFYLWKGKDKNLRHL